MTYLQLVNEVLKRLREKTVASVSSNTYSTMVGAFVNDAKRQIEQDHNWSANRSEVALSTTASVRTLSLTGFGQEGEVLSLFNDTSNTEFKMKSQGWFDRQKWVAGDMSGSPYNFCFRGEDGNDDAVIEMWPVPDDVYAVKLNMYTPQDDLSDDSDVLNIPPRPVYLLAVAMLAEEKGETGGATSARYFAMAEKALSQSIAYDAGKNPIEHIWYGD